MSHRQIRADVLLIRNVKALLESRRLDQGNLARWCGHRPPWISKILSTERGVKLQDLGKIADFFGLSVAELFQFGISRSFERRAQNRRRGIDRRSGHERRKEQRQ